MNENRRLILSNGEKYIKSVDKKKVGRPSELPRSYDEARTLVRNGVQKSLEIFEEMSPKRKIPNEAVFCLRLHPDAQAKSYSPKALLDDVPEIRSIGSRAYRIDLSKVAQTTRVKKELKGEPSKESAARLLFVQGSPAGFKALIKKLDRTEQAVPRKVKEDIQRVESFDLLKGTEQVVGFDSEWDDGRGELVLHPSRTSNERQMRFIFELFDDVGIDSSKSQIRTYPSGPTFISCRLNRSILANLSGSNPLRAVHPLIFGGLQDLRNAATAPAPMPTISDTKSTIKVGMFDGGVDQTVPLLNGHVEVDETLEIASTPDANSIAHGTAVAGALLYGELNGLKGSDRVDAPPVSVVSIRALPTSDPSDIDLYESIDVVENAVSARSDIKVFNLSFGPRGPIQDDAISRFTYVLDSLACTHKVTFFVAVGNDGEVDGYNRIQAPADLVHGIGVGAYTRHGDDIVHASYSCRGPGRECGKIKPDVSAFGGSEDTPIHLASTNSNEKLLAWGTSFASPLAARLGAVLASSFDRSSALLARALLVHTAVPPKKKPDQLFGNGRIQSSVDDVLACDMDSVTVVFQGDIVPTHIVRLPIPWLERGFRDGTVRITWTIGTLASINPNHLDDYTCGCVEDTFYPHSSKFAFVPPKGTSQKKRQLNIDTESEIVSGLVLEGWKQSQFPSTESGNKYADEKSRRIDCKWEPLVKRSVSKQVSSLHNPFLTLHAISRHETIDRFDYVAVVTIRANKYDGDLYSEIRKQYPALAPIRVRTEAEIRIEI